jgi:hypothetical protein
LRLNSGNPTLELFKKMANDVNAGPAATTAAATTMAPFNAICLTDGRPCGMV